MTENSYWKLTDVCCRQLLQERAHHGFCICSNLLLSLAALWPLLTDFHIRASHLSFSEPQQLASSASVGALTHKLPEDC